jgi:serine/threonine protein kinase
MPADLQRARELFLHAVGKLPPEQWDAYLAEACGSDSELQRQVAHLLQVHREAGSFLEQPAIGVGVTSGFTPAPEGGASGAPPGTPGLPIGAYRLSEEIGTGGMGTVWRAEQTEPVRRQVALKLVKAGMDSEQVLARFEAERQALALMDHPNIARVLDAGATPAGRPYFVMELVQGLSITCYCDEHRLTLRQRLELFVPVCRAVQHAHQKGIIHRDIKPSNVLVCQYDRKPVPKVIDFGIAKATGPQLTEQTLVTGFGAVVGTLEYMSPEQAELNQLDIDTRSDIYSLGVLLYELLTGTTPLERRRLKETPMLEVLRVIREEEPPRPSTRLSDSRDSLPTISSQRETEPAKLTRLVRGELDWIVMKALDKDRGRRYQTANDFAQDVERYLSDEPVLACPPAAGYRLRKLLRRNKGAVLAASLLLLSLIGGVIGTTVGMVRAGEALEAEADQSREADRAAAAEKQANQAAQLRLQQSRKANDILVSIFRDLNLAREENNGIPLRAQLAERLTTAAGLLDGEAVGDAETVARMQVLLGQTMTSLGYPEPAIAVLTKARHALERLLGASHADTLTVMYDLADACRSAGKLDTAVQLYRETLDRRRAALGADDKDTLASMNGLAVAYREAGKPELALPLCLDALARAGAKWGEDDPRTLACANNVAVLYNDAGKLERALQLYRDMLEKTRARQGPDHLDTLASMNNLAQTSRETGLPDRALPMALDALSRCKAKLGPDHPHTLTAQGNLALTYQDLGKLELALPLHIEALQRRKVKLGADHPATLKSMNNLADLYLELNRLESALPLYRDALEMARARLGTDHPHTLRIMDNLALAHRKAGDFDEALKLGRERLSRTRAKRGPGHPETLRSMASLAATYAAAGRSEPALQLCREAVNGLRQRPSDDHPDMLTTLNEVGEIYYTSGRPNLALPLYQEGAQKREGLLGPDHPDTLTSRRHLAVLFAAVGRLDLAVPLYEEVLQKMKARRPDHAQTLTCMSNLGDAYRATKKYALAVPLLVEALQKHKDKLGADHHDTLATMNTLAMAYHDSGKLDQALPLLVEALEKMKAKPGGADHPLTLTVLNNLARTYRSQGQLERALPLYVETLRRRQARLGADHPDTLWSMHNLAGAYLEGHKYAEAEPLLAGWLERQPRQPADDLQVAWNLNRLGECRLALEKPAGAEAALRRARAIYLKRAPRSVLRYDTENQLGAALAGQKKLAEAEPLLTASASVLLKVTPRLSKEAKRLGAAAARRVIDFYLARGNAEEAARWRTLLAEAFPSSVDTKEGSKRSAPR